MLNNYRFISKPNTNVNNTLKINACSGGIYKTYKESWFTRFNLNDSTAKTLFKPYDNKMQVEKDESIWDSDINRFYRHAGKEKEVIILQMIICGDMEVIAELITEEDFNKYFKDEEENKIC